jgi:hypothetical protein
MPLLTERRLLLKAQQVTTSLRKSAVRILEESATTQRDQFDLFLSHSIEDASLVLGAKAEFEAAGYAVYVDWINDPQMSREEVNADTAATLRRRMRQCKCLFYLRTLNSEVSKWMPWELGFFDGFSGRVAILPISKNVRHSYDGLEYLGIYPYVDVAQAENGRERFWINRSPDRYASLAAWLIDPTRIRRHS